MREWHVPCRLSHCAVFLLVINCHWNADCIHLSALLWKTLSNSTAICFVPLLSQFVHVIRVAVLFILEVDDVLFATWIPDSTKVQIERFRNSASRASTENDSRLLTVTKQAHTVLIFCAIVTPVLLIAVFGLWHFEGVVNELPIFVCPFVAAWIGAAFEIRVSKGKIVNAIGAAFVGLFAIMFAMSAQHLKKDLFY